MSGWRAFYREVEEQATGRLGGFEWGVVLVSALGLMVMYFGGQQQQLCLKVVQSLGLVSDESLARYLELILLGCWVGMCVLGYLMLPMIYLRACGRSLSDYYLGFQGFKRHISVYLTLFLPASALVVWVSYWPDFQKIYPFYTLANRSVFDLVMWELLYGVQFFALEFFFRAFMLESLRRALGFGGLLFMLLPYCMIHFDKTAAESAGSIVAGIILGMLAMRGRSIWGGVMLHWLIAIQMDVLSLAQKGQLPPLSH